MIIRYASDLHIEGIRHNLRTSYSFKGMNKERKQFLLLMGDIDTRLAVKNFIKSISHRFKAIVWIAGNHEYYKGDIVELSKWFKEDMPDNVFFLDNDFIIIEDTVFIGSTLWTDFDNANKELMDFADKEIADFDLIDINGQKLTSKIAFELNQISREYIDSKLDEYSDLKKVVLSHFSPEVSFSEYGDELSCYFHNTKMESIYSKADYWFFGHTHQKLDKEYKGTRFLSNQLGYWNKQHPNFEVIEKIYI